jgi:ribosomal protein L7/L12
MTDATELPEDVVAAIHANHKIKAIKLLREHRDIGLKEAKQLVDDYLGRLPPDTITGAQRADSGMGRILLVAAGAALIYLLYNFFS